MGDLLQKVLSRIHLYCWQNKMNVNKLLLLPNLLWTEKKIRELDIYSSSLLAKQVKLHTFVSRDRVGVFPS